jgi:hypothetical protein
MKDGTCIGILSGSPLNSGNTWTCKVPQGSVVEVDETLICDMLPGGGNVNEVTEGAAESCGANAEGRWPRFPSRCISRDTSLES